MSCFRLLDNTHFPDADSVSAILTNNTFHRSSSSFIPFLSFLFQILEGESEVTIMDLLEMDIDDRLRLAVTH